MNSKLKPNRGEVWIVNLALVTGHEQAKRRPCVIISNNIFNQNVSELAVIIPLTSKYKNVSWMVNVGEIAIGKTKITSYALCNHVRTVSLSRFSSKPVGRINSEAMQAVEARLRILLDL